MTQKKLQRVCLGFMPSFSGTIGRFLGESAGFASSRSRLNKVPGYFDVAHVEGDLALLGSLAAATFLYCQFKTDAQ